MENTTEISLLEHFLTPAFCVENGVVTLCNQTASQLMIHPGDAVAPLIHTGKQEYRDFDHGCLYLTLTLHGKLHGASVTRQKGTDVFVADAGSTDPALCAYALAARELREPLASIMTAADRLFPSILDGRTPQEQAHMASINQGLYQLLRIVGNMSDAIRYHGMTETRMENLKISGVITELMDVIAETCGDATASFSYSFPRETIYCPMNRQLVERAVYNLISNALKFTPPEGQVEVTVKKAGKRLYITVADNGSGIPGSLHGTLFSRYQRSAGIEDPRHGIGLGLVLVRAAAAAHGGTVLMQPTDCGSRITMTLSLEQKVAALSSPVLRVDYTGERSHCLVELSQCLELARFSPEEIN